MKLSNFVGSMALAGVMVATTASGAAQQASSAPEVSTRQPLGKVFTPGKARLSQTGELWLKRQVVQAAKRPDRMVIVSITGADPALQQQRANVIRQRLAALGVTAEHIYFEAT